ncbi:uncharacterized protein MYCGRDRAFT_92472 [Zymoseptoria tritici IPO323]|uniref:Uncharacterized protein n=1 Tax=Zymoseptoria tritici (strain CBS 115943 / IPO323) TaxID=336722 RepID=F9X8Y6_ZYMTI|nr:uncharacterized protein MYCGRDRAFT_92472 [Zymoseptoria tritici IPO323]EGP88448.1 hypothetical protein MYCGRDRAFT_92472 [Zymoseptoria tritici IPO323]
MKRMGFWHALSIFLPHIRTQTEEFLFRISASSFHLISRNLTALASETYDRYLPAHHHRCKAQVCPATSYPNPPPDNKSDRLAFRQPRMLLQFLAILAAAMALVSTETL